MKGCDGFVLVYDITNEESFANIQRIYITEIEKHYSLTERPIVLIGNKADQEQQRAVPSEVASVCFNSIRVVSKM
jgi:GTPase SAR1 family protein